MHPFKITRQPPPFAPNLGTLSRLSQKYCFYLGPTSRHGATKVQRPRPRGQESLVRGRHTQHLQRNSGNSSTWRPCKCSLFRRLRNTPESNDSRGRWSQSDRCLENTLRRRHGWNFQLGGRHSSRCVEEPAPDCSRGKVFRHRWRVQTVDEGGRFQGAVPRLASGHDEGISGQCLLLPRLWRSHEAAQQLYPISPWRINIQRGSE